MARSTLDEFLARRAAERVLDALELCSCPIQVIRLAREVPEGFLATMECDCPYCQMELAKDFQRWIEAFPEKVSHFHRPGASAAVSPGEQRDDNLIGPAC